MPYFIVGDFYAASGKLSTCTGVTINFFFALSLWLLISLPLEDHLLWSRLAPVTKAVAVAAESCSESYL